MPIYQYRCKKCGKEDEILQRITESAVHICDNCGSVMSRVISPVGIIFKGGGFHVTDYKKGNSKAVPTSRKKEGDSVSSEKKSETSTEVKTEAKSETGTSKKDAKK